jgi:RNA 3'-terminal phosphate cyclase-like protein
MARDYWFAFGPQPSTASGLAPTFITFVNSSGATIAPPTITETYVGTGLYKANYNATQTIAFVLDGATTSLTTNIRYIFGVFDPEDTAGQTLVAFGNTAVALGLSNIALGTTNVAIGTSNIALGMTNVAIGTSNIALGMTGIAFGATNVAIGTSNIALGMTNVALGTSNISLGMTNVAIGTSNIALGMTNVAIGLTNVAIGTSLAFVATSIGSTASSFGDSATDPGSVFGYLKRVSEFLEGNQTYTKSTGGLVFYSRGSSATIASKTVSDTTSQTTKT